MNHVVEVNYSYKHCEMIFLIDCGVIYERHSQRVMMRIEFMKRGLTGQSV